MTDEPTERTSPMDTIVHQSKRIAEQAEQLFQYGRLINEQAATIARYEAWGLRLKLAFADIPAAAEKWIDLDTRLHDLDLSNVKIPGAVWSLQGRALYNHRTNLRESDVIYTLRDLVQWREVNLRKIRNQGAKKIAATIQFLHEHGLRLGMTSEDITAYEALKEATG